MVFFEGAAADRSPHHTLGLVRICSCASRARRVRVDCGVSIRRGSTQPLTSCGPPITKGRVCLSARLGAPLAAHGGAPGLDLSLGLGSYLRKPSTPGSAQILGRLIRQRLANPNLANCSRQLPRSWGTVQQLAVHAVGGVVTPARGMARKVMDCAKGTALGGVVACVVGGRLFSVARPA